MDIAGAITSILGGNNSTAGGLVESVIKNITSGNGNLAEIAKSAANGLDISSITKVLANGDTSTITDILGKLGVNGNIAGSLQNMSGTDIASAAGKAADVLKSIFGGK